MSKHINNSELFECKQDEVTHLLMDMAKMTGCQPDLRTCLVVGERRAIMAQAGIRSRKKPQTVGGRYHMSGH